MSIVSLARHDDITMMGCSQSPWRALSEGTVVIVSVRTICAPLLLQNVYEA